MLTRERTYLMCAEEKEEKFECDQVWYLYWLSNPEIDKREDKKGGRNNSQRIVS